MINHKECGGQKHSLGYRIGLLHNNPKNASFRSHVRKQGYVQGHRSYAGILWLLPFLHHSNQVGGIYTTCHHFHFQSTCVCIFCTVSWFLWRETQAMMMMMYWHLLLVLCHNVLTCHHESRSCFFQGHHLQQAWCRGRDRKRMAQPYTIL